MEKQPTNRRGFRSFPLLFWLVVIFEFFERGSYYGMMSFISVYFVDVLNFPKENVGVEEQFHRCLSRTSQGISTGETISPRILPVPLAEPSHFPAMSAGSGGTT